MKRICLGFCIAIFGLAGAVIPAFAGDSCVTAACHSILGKARFVHGPVAAGECDTCHIKSDRPHPGSKGAIRLISQGKDLCANCHVLREGPFTHTAFANCTGCHSPHQGNNSKLLYLEGPSLCFRCHADPGQGKTRHPALEAGCTSCHDPHSGSAAGMTAVTGTALCLTCHPDPRKGKKVAHAPAAEGECAACHDPHAGVGSALLRAPVAQLCEQCHTSPTAGKARVHSAVLEGCTGCHDPHGGAAKGLLPVAGRALCLQCHDDPVQTKAVVHQPAASGSCQTCHDPHGGEGAILASSESALCLRCHRKITEGKAFLHTPVKEGECTSCHGGHGGAFKGLLAVRNQADLCAGCHDDKRLGERVHGPVKAGNCRLCHDPHAGVAAGQLIRPGGEVCFGCHGSIGRQIKASPFQHQPVGEGRCQACHAPHGSTHRPHLLDRNPRDFYLSFKAEEFALCFRCHSSDAFLFERTSEATRFRNGDRNLHFLHVNKEDKGRACKICHGVHGADQQKLIQSRIPDFGAWDIPISLEVHSNGGTCYVGCHGPKTYDWVRPVR